MKIMNTKYLPNRAPLLTSSADPRCWLSLSQFFSVSQDTCHRVWKAKSILIKVTQVKSRVMHYCERKSYASSLTGYISLISMLPIQPPSVIIECTHKKLERGKQDYKCLGLKGVLALYSSNWYFFQVQLVPNVRPRSLWKEKHTMCIHS